jgi:hypothetical protein
MLTFSPSNVTSTFLLRFDDPMLMLTARFMAEPPGIKSSASIPETHFFKGKGVSGFW